MKITIEQTDIALEWSGVTGRVRRGVTERGVRVDVIVVAIAIPEGSDEFAILAELEEIPPPAEAELIELRFDREHTP